MSRGCTVLRAFAVRFAWGKHLGRAACYLASVAAAGAIVPWAVSGPPLSWVPDHPAARFGIMLWAACLAAVSVDGLRLFAEHCLPQLWRPVHLTFTDQGVYVPIAPWPGGQLLLPYVVVDGWAVTDRGTDREAMVVRLCLGPDKLSHTRPFRVFEPMAEVERWFARTCPHAGPIDPPAEG